MTGKTKSGPSRSARSEWGGAREAPSSRVLVIGDVMSDVIVRPEGRLARGSDRRAAITVEPGGSAANQAAWLAYWGAAVDLVARVGASDLAAESARLRAAGVSPYLAGDPNIQTGRLVAMIGRDGERSFLTDRGANDALCADDIPDSLIAGASHIHISGYSLFAASPRAAILDVMRRAGETPVSIDPASAGFLREVGPRNFLDWTKGAAMLFPNEEEAAVLSGAKDPELQCARLAARYPLVVIKLGAAGCFAAAGAERWRVAAPKVAVLDTTGSGDAFLAAFLAATLVGTQIPEALRRAVAAGSATACKIGGRPSAKAPRDDPRPD